MSHYKPVYDANDEMVRLSSVAAELERENATLRKLLDEVRVNLERDVAAMPMFPITAENAEAAQDAMTGVCFTLGVLRVRDHELVRAGEQGANDAVKPRSEAESA